MNSIKNRKKHYLTGARVPYKSTQYAALYYDDHYDISQIEYYYMASGFYSEQWIHHTHLNIVNLGLKVGCFNHTIVGDPLKHKYFIYLPNIYKCLLFTCDMEDFIKFIDSFIEDRLTILNHTVEHKGILI
jgi:hypothetical protein